ncbi:MAG: hypothetical protein JRN34_00665 [Nitrososphaerota archaeon]|jgi:hypothetical protein|nr:hypothetical protein [Nitrososphaerota archaeon]
MIKAELAVIQAIGEKPIYRLEELLQVTGSRATAYRTLAELRQIGFAEPAKEGYFTIRSSLFQPFNIWQHLVPSLNALKHARYFGRSYNENDVKKASEILHGIVTLDYRAYDLTRLQEPHSLFVYVNNLDSAAEILREHGFWEGTRGRVVLLPQVGSPQNEIQRVYLDCLAYGGRSTLDAIAIEMLHGEHLDPRVKGVFKSEDVLKVKEELASNEP